jgi:hypothetical protein
MDRIASLLPKREETIYLKELPVEVTEKLQEVSNANRALLESLGEDVKSHNCDVEDFHGGYEDPHHPWNENDDFVSEETDPFVMKLMELDRVLEQLLDSESPDLNLYLQQLPARLIQIVGPFLLRKTEFHTSGYISRQTGEEIGSLLGEIEKTKDATRVTERPHDVGV